MNNRFSELFIRRPVATTLLTIGIAFAGLLAFGRLPVSPLPQIDFATVNVQANMPGASPDNMASAVAAPLEKHLGQIADVIEMTSQSMLGNTRITVQFGLNGARRRGGDQCGAGGLADQPAPESGLSQGQPGRRAHNGPRADFAHAPLRSAL